MAVTLVLWLLAWLGGFGGHFVHLLLPVALALLIVQIVSSRRTA